MITTRYISEVTVAVATFLLLPYIILDASSVIALHDIILTSSVETVLPEPNLIAKAKIFSSQVVDRSLKSDKLMSHNTGDQAAGPTHIPMQTPIAPNQKIKIGCERPYSVTVSLSINDMTGRCLTNAGRLRHALG
jgi:hypothetical protein